MHADAEVDTNGNKTNAIIMSSAAYAQIEIRAMIDTPYIFFRNWHTNKHRLI